MANNSKVKLSAAVRKARRKPAEEPETVSEAVRAGTAPEMESPVAVAPLAKCGGIVPALGRIVRRTAYGTLYGVTYTVVFPWALVR